MTGGRNGKGYGVLPTPHGGVMFRDPLYEKLSTFTHGKEIAL